MPTNRKEYMREYMARKRAEKKARADAVLLAETPLIDPFPPGSDRLLDHYPDAPQRPLVKPKPSFLAAPDDDCSKCSHDRHSSQHVYGPCQAWVGKRRCLCQNYDLGFD